MKDMIGQIIHGDSLEVMKDIPDKSIGLILTDPPYSAHVHEKHLSKVANRQNIDFKNIDENSISIISKEFKRLSRGWSVFTCDWEYMKKLKQIEFLIRFGVWVKPNSAPQFTGDRPAQGWEAIAICHDKGRKKWNGGGNRAVWIENIAQGLHPTQKPLSLWIRLLKDFSNENDLILDPFSGSGTTAIACHRLNRRFICIEKEKKYIDLSRRRLEEEQAQMKMF